MNIRSDCNFYHGIPENTFYGGVGIYVHNSIVDLCAMVELKMGKQLVWKWKYIPKILLL